MNDPEKTRDQLIAELTELRQRNAKLEAQVVALRDQESARRDAEATATAMIDAFDGLIYVCSPTYEVEFMNERFIQRTGHDPTGQKCYKALHDRKDICPWCVNERVQRGETVRWEVQSPKDHCWYYVVNTPIRHQDGTISKMAVIQDITERKRAESIKLARSRLVEYSASHYLDELLQATLDEVEMLTNSKIGFYHFVEADGRTLCLQAWSTRTLREMCTAEGRYMHYGIEEAGVWVDCVHERKPVIHNDYSALPHRRGMPAGHADVVRELVVPVFRSDRIVAILGVGNKPVDYDASDIETVSLLADLAWDIAERKKAEEALRESQERLELAMEGAELGMWDWNIQTGDLVFNDQWCGMLGYSREEVRPHIDAWESSIHPKDRAKVKDALMRHVAGGSPSYEVEYRTLSKSGEWRWVVARGKVVRWDQDGKPVRATGTRLDMTERKRAEKLVRERTEALERSNRDLEQFAYVAAHDLREPLIAVGVYLKLLERRCGDRLDDEARTFIARAIDTTLRMDGLIQSLLAYSRIGNENRPFGATDGNMVLKDALSNVHAAVTESGAVVTSDTLPTVLADASQLVQLFQNLLSNAIRFRGERPLRIHVGCTHREGETEFFVRDNGIGIEERHFQRIFRIFQRVDDCPHRSGTGIGLASCMRIVERHGGTIWVESEPGAGSTFFFTLPEVPAQP
ncbi:MAG: GAF domain-containing protein [Thermodesulfobacteriota bacterium]